ncbi:EAL domain-containing protein [Wukongibacter baidiensis]|uniref:EAL domain-containing protein n=1 Tax=Wukongibacter baidiensis TaxID=1723361 RepID=UPI003D7FB9C4
MDNYINITAKLIEAEIQKFLDEQAVIADIFQKTIDNEEEFAPLIKSMTEQSFFKDNLEYSGKWYQNHESEPAVVLVQQYLLDEENNIRPEIKEQIDQSIILDLLMPSFHKYGTDKLWIYFSGGLGASFMRVTPWDDIGTAMDQIYPKHTYEPNWEAFNPGLVGNWEKAIREDVKDLSSLSIISSPTQDGGTGNIIMTLRQPIWNKERDKFRGAISIDVEIQEIISLVKNIKLAHSGFAYISQSNGNVFAVNNEGAKTLGLRAIEDAIVKNDTESGYNPMSRFLRESIHEEVQNILLPKGNKITKNRVKIDGKEYFVIQKNLKTLNTWNKDKGFYTEAWTLGFVIPEEEVFFSYHNARNKIDDSRGLIIMKQFLILGLVVLGISVFIYFTTKRITSDLRKLELVTVEVMNKNYDVKVDVKSNDEIGRLAAAIKNMIIEIKNTVKQLSTQNEILKWEIANREKKERRIKYLEDYDTLTNLPKQSLFLSSLQEYIDSIGSDGLHGTVMVIGLDNFRRVNEVLGHIGGNQILKMVSTRLKSILKDAGIVARISGDEFAIIYNDISSMEEIILQVENIMNTVKSPYMVNDKEILITASIGISSYPIDSVIPSELLKFASSALIHTKENQKGNYQFYDIEMNKSAQKRNKMVTALRHGIENNEFELYYQPQLSLNTRKLTGVEALIRWNSSTFGKIMPGVFIPLAEDTGLINRLGEWILREACIQNKKWHDMGYHNLVVSVNLSPIQFNDKNLVEKIKMILEETGLAPRFLELEVTERLLISDKKDVINMLHRLRQLGIRISIDDFGTGYSSLSYIKDLPVDKLKIDRSFIKDIPNNDDGTIANIIIELGKSLNLIINAEGVETKEQERFLKERKCNEVQGYYYSRPICSYEFTEKLKDGFNINNI